MSFIHESSDFRDLVLVAAENRGLAFPSMAEKDYWITHTLWALGQCDLELWFKGGTSLAKAWGLVERFSEDIDLRLESKHLPKVTSWTSDRKGAIESRRAHFDAMAKAIRVPGARVRVGDAQDDLWRSADILVEYKPLFDPSEPLVPYVRIEAGMARVTPFVERDISSFVHGYLQKRGELGSFDDNQAHRVRVVHPLVTLIEKLDAISRRYARDSFQAQTFVRHYEDAARIVAAVGRLPALEMTTDELLEEMLRLKQIKQRPTAEDPGFMLSDPDKSKLLQQAYDAIGGMFWGERISLEEAARSLRSWIGSLG